MIEQPYSGCPVITDNITTEEIYSVNIFCQFAIFNRMKTDAAKLELITWLSQLEDKAILSSLLFFKKIVRG